MKNPKCKRDPRIKYRTLLPEHLFMISGNSTYAKSPHIYPLSKNLKLFFFFPQRTWVSIFTGLLVPLVICDLWEKTLKRCSSSFSCFVSIPESQSTFLTFTWVNWVLRPRWNDAETCWPSLGCFRYSSWVGDQGPNS